MVVVDRCRAVPDGGSGSGIMIESIKGGDGDLVERGIVITIGSESVFLHVSTIPGLCGSGGRFHG